MILIIFCLTIGKILLDRLDSYHRHYSGYFFRITRTEGRCWRCNGKCQYYLDHNFVSQVELFRYWELTTHWVSLSLTITTTTVPLPAPLLPCEDRQCTTDTAAATAIILLLLLLLLLLYHLHLCLPACLHDTHFSTMCVKEFIESNRNPIH